ncbi:hypothetical protein DPMN_192188, partial [Dreissena polymorpha]
MLDYNHVYNWEIPNAFVIICRRIYCGKGKTPHTTIRLSVKADRMLSIMSSNHDTVLQTMLSCSHDAKAVGDSSFPNVTLVISHNAHRLACVLSNSTVHRWTHEYLTSLREFQTKGGNNHQTIRLCDVVIVQDDFKPRLQWTLAVVDELLTGNDGLTRAARLRTS